MIRRDQQQAQRSKRSAFTLMEMLVVVAIIVALAGMGGFYFIGVLNDSKKDNAKVQCATLNQAIETYYIKNKDYPTDLNQLFQKTPHGEAVLKQNKQDAIIDPWGKAYIYDQQTHEVHTTDPQGVRIPPQ